MSDAEAIVYLNGAFVPIRDAKISVLDRGFIFGDGVYEVIPAYGREPFRMPHHLARLAHSLRRHRPRQSARRCRVGTPGARAGRAPAVRATRRCTCR